MHEELKYLSDRNLVRYYREELLRVHRGEKITEVFTENTRRSLRLHGLTHGHGAGNRLTDHALRLLKEVKV